jgi:DNA-binding transcriptional LysR family regulator
MKNIAGVDLNLMKAFEAMMIEGSVSRAAERVGLAQPSMSNALARLRALFDDPLFVRSSAGMRPTEKAKVIAPLVSRALGALRAAINDAGVFDPATMPLTVRIMMPDYGELTLLPLIAQQLQDVAPLVQIISVPFDRCTYPAKLEQGDIDLVIGVLRAPPPRIAVERVVDERFVCIARKGHPAIGETLDLATFVAQPQALVAPGGSLSGAVDRALSVVGESRRLVMSVGNFISLPFLIADSDIIAVIGERVARRLAAHIDIVIYPVPIDVAGFALSMAWDSAMTHSAGQSWFRDIVRDVSAQLR